MKLFKFLLIAFFAMTGHYLYAQNSIVKGVITDDFNNFVEGAKIALDGTTLEAFSNNKGIFEIKDVPFGSYTLVVTADNHSVLSKEIKVSETTTDLGFLSTQVTGSVAEEMQENVSVVTISDSELKEASTTSVSGVLSASRDAFNAAAA